MALLNQVDFDALGKVSNKAVKDAARVSALDALFSLLVSYLGDEGVSRVGSGTLAISVGSRTVSDGTVPEVSVEIKVTAKEFEGHASSGKSAEWVEAYDRLEAAQDYAEEVAAKEAEAAEKAKAKAAKIAKAEADRAAKAKAKAAKSGA